MQDEEKISALAQSMETYFGAAGITSAQVDMALIQIEHRYYMHDAVATLKQQQARETEMFGCKEERHPACFADAGFSNAAAVPASSDTSSAFVNPAYSALPIIPPVVTELASLCKFVYVNGDTRAKTRAVLCQIYHHAIHDRYRDARDLMLMSHLHENVAAIDVLDQVLFNRTQAQVRFVYLFYALMTEYSTLI